MKVYCSQRESHDTSDLKMKYFQLSRKQATVCCSLSESQEYLLHNHNHYGGYNTKFSAQEKVEILREKSGHHFDTFNIKTHRNAVAITSSPGKVYKNVAPKC